MAEQNNKRVKLLADFFIDIFGALIPGILCLFSVLFGILLPAISLLWNHLTPNGLKYLPLFDGWFWVVFFLVVLLLGYVIGHVFYRMDINKIDRISFEQQMNAGISQLEREFEDWCRDKRIDEAVPVQYGRLRKLLLRVRRRFCPTNVNPTRGRLKALLGRWITISDSLRRYFTNKIGMMCGELLYAYRGHGGEYSRFFGIDPDSPDDWIKVMLEFIDGDNRYPDRCKRMNHKVFYAMHKLVFTEMHGHKAAKFLTSTAQTIDRRMSYRRRRDAGREWVEKIRECLPADAERVIDYYEARVREWLGNIYRDGFDRKDDLTVRMTALYLILYVQTEGACDLPEHCDFPYASYYKYLLRRHYFDLARLAKWNNYLTRSKIALNDYKLQMQVLYPQTYQILIKNESHIRMASSTCSVYQAMKNTLRLVAVAVLVCLFFVFIGSFGSEGSAAGSVSYSWVALRDLWYIPRRFFGDFMVFLFRHSYMWMPPLLTRLLLSAIYRHILVFLHYQREREIFQVLHIYDILGRDRKAREKAEREKGGSYYC